ncbi:tetratricopeptide repeat protein [Flavobacterium rakeshii]|uniref:Tetratricopeptide repeat protein n=1 Tax=Flavobacterium rakeshii TaxID=1038845 RepID=A0A6N8HFT4_9FLAO|nr:tetratricopeptide repeat protein [Flavobacterium rakeshii]MUV04541.1 tetratricopeptide repeat protein [Flavobacterium rakeshii]
MRFTLQLKVLSLFILLITKFTLKAQDKRVLDSLTNIIEHTSDNDLKIETLLKRSDVYPLALSERAEQDILQAEKIALADSNYKRLAEVYNFYGYLLRALGNNQKAITVFGKSRAAAISGDRVTLKGHAEQNMGTTYASLAQNDSALYWLDEAYRTYSSVENTKTQFFLNVVASKGLLYNNVGKYDLAIIEFDKAIALYGSDTENRILSGIYGNKGNALNLMHKHEDAIDNYIKALKINEKYKDSARIMYNLNNIGLLFSNLNDYQTAKKYHLRALTIAKRLGYDERNPYYNMNLAQDYKGLQRIDSAYINFKKALEIAASIDNDSWRAVTYRNYGNFLLTQKDYKAAEEYLTKALKIFEVIQNITEIASVKSSLASIKIENNKLGEAQTFLNSVDSLKGVGYLRPMTTAIANQVAIEYDSIIGNKDSLLVNYKRQLTLLDSLYNQNEKMAVLKAEANYQIERQELLHQIEVQKSKQKRITTLIFAIILAGIAIIILIVMVLKRRQAKLLHTAQLEQLEQEHLLNLANTLSQAEQDERKNIAHKLHDEVGNLLSIAQLNVSQLATSGGIQETGQQAKLQATSRVLGEITESIRTISHSLMPIALEKFGLKPALQDLVSLLNTSDDIHVEVIIDGIDDTTLWPAQLPLTIYRMVNEVLNNILKHAKAGNILLQIIELENAVTVYIEDDGIGYSDTANTKNGRGLVMLKNSIEYCKGMIEISKAPNGGTFVFAEIPTHID